MRKRTKNIHIRLDEEEYEYLMTMVKKSGLSIQSYIMALIYDKPIRERPPMDFLQTLKPMQYISNNMNQIAMKANALGFVDTVAYWQNVDMLQSTIGKMIEMMFGY